LAAEPEKTSTWAVERFDPNDGGPIMAYEHIHRYAGCAEIVRGRRVLDVACGEGYGAALIARTAKCVVGTDIDADVVRVAQARYGRDGLEFLRADMFELPFKSRSFDVVTCFEAIEHVSTPSRALDEIARVVASGGTAIISTPDKAVYSDAENYENEYHLHEFYRDEFYDELRQRFSTVSLMGQRIRAGSELVALDPSARSLPSVISYLPDPVDASRVDVSPSRYLIAVCRDGESPEDADGMAPGVLLDGSDRLIDEYIASVQGAAALAAEKDHTIAELAALLAQRDAELLELNLEVVNSRAYAVEINRQYELSVTKENALGDELLRVTRESEERAVYLLAVEEQLSTLRLPDRSA
jgi:ubiquinone/menaquinone biosynthesis C-methylase UbiE